MAWKPGPTDPKYRTAEHRRVRAEMVKQLRRDGFLICTADQCVFPSRTITNPNGIAPDGLQAGHAPDGVTYRGPQHKACNITEAVLRSTAGEPGPPKRWVF